MSREIENLYRAKDRQEKIRDELNRSIDKELVPFLISYSLAQNTKFKLNWALERMALNRVLQTKRPVLGRVGTGLLLWTATFYVGLATEFVDNLIKLFLVSNRISALEEEISEKRVIQVMSRNLDFGIPPKRNVDDRFNSNFGMGEYKFNVMKLDITEVKKSVDETLESILLGVELEEVDDFVQKESQQNESEAQDNESETHFQITED